MASNQATAAVANYIASYFFPGLSTVVDLHLGRASQIGKEGMLARIWFSHSIVLYPSRNK